MEEKKVKMDEFYFKKYSKYVKQNAGSKAGLNVFLTLKGCRKTSYFYTHKRYSKSFLHILKYYKMYFDSYDEDNITTYIISKKPISEDVKYAFRNNDYDVKNPHIMGKFLEYPYFMNVRKVSVMKNIGAINFYFLKNKKDKNKEIIYGFRIPNNKINPKIINNMNNIMKKYKKCIQKHLYTIFPHFTIEMNVRLN